MKVGLIGKRSSGKTTLYEAISGLEVDSLSKPQLINISKIKVKDKNIDSLSQIFMPKKTTYAELDVTDYNRSLDTSDSLLGGPALIAKYRELDAYVIVIGVIDDIDYIRNEVSDIISELGLLDIMILDAKIQRMKKSKYDKNEMDLYQNILTKLESNELPSKEEFSKEDLKLLSSFQLFCLKPWMIALNVSEDLIGISPNVSDVLNLPHVVLSAEIEKDLNTLSEQEKIDFLKDLGLTEGIKDRFVNMIYDTLDLISFYTVGSDEVRAWSISRGTHAQAAAGKIHSDIERGFIRAETIHYNEFMNFKDEIKAKAAGQIRSEGKTYIVKDGDIIHFRFNV